MITMMICIMLMSTISMLIFLISMMISKKSMYNINKMSPFECGFNPINMKRIPFSMHFFLITILFLIFDIEITIILPFIMLFKLNNILMINLTFNLFIIILFIGLMHEWNQGILNWKI
uniref:NADH-ubiquinone oxidoreductase chain 3 n=1 Tax=Ecnomus sp. XG-2021 TaxID=2996734 RepID=A0A9E8LNU9_9NEOP|nr:NADH dehydrogenase subunit 3 [Ecnomus sp. XG-2021]